MQRALDGLGELRAARARRSASTGNREYNPGWHTALDLAQPADRLRGDHALGPRAQGEPRRPLPRGLSRTRTPAFGKFNVVVRKGADGRMQVARVPAPARCRAELQAGHRGDEVMAQRDLPHLARRRARAARFQDYTTEVVRGHGRARRRPPDPGRAGQRPGRALELQGRQVRLLLGRDQRQAAAHVHDAADRPRRSTSRSPSSRCRPSRCSRTWSPTCPGTSR